MHSQGIPFFLFLFLAVPTATQTSRELLPPSSVPPAIFFAEADHTRRHAPSRSVILLFHLSSWLVTPPPTTTTSLLVMRVRFRLYSDLISSTSLLSSTSVVFSSYRHALEFVYHFPASPHCLCLLPYPFRTPNPKTMESKPTFCGAASLFYGVGVGGILVLVLSLSTSLSLSLFFWCSLFRVW